jgi:hypothetical protein
MDTGNVDGPTPEELDAALDRADRGSALLSDLWALPPRERIRALARMSLEDRLAVRLAMEVTGALIEKHQEGYVQALVDTQEPEGPDERALVEARVRDTFSRAVGSRSD